MKMVQRRRGKGRRKEGRRKDRNGKGKRNEEGEGVGKGGGKGGSKRVELSNASPIYSARASQKPLFATQVIQGDGVAGEREGGREG